MSGLKVLVVGASIAGPTTAYWLAKAGAKVTIIERFPELRAGGQAVDIRTVGVSVMRKMSGMEAQVRSKSTQEEGVSFVRDDGRPYGVIRATGNPDKQSIISEYEIFRGDLAKILFGLTENNENIKYVFGEQIASMQSRDPGDGPITVEFANGYLPTAEYDLVVGCDGATSRTRAMGFGCRVRDHIVPTNSWAAYFSIQQQDLLHGRKIGQGYSAPGGRFLSIGPDPSGCTRVTLLSILRPRPSDSGSDSGSDTTLPFRQAAAQGDVALKEYITQHFRTAGWKTALLLREMLTAPDFYASEITQVILPHLYHGRCVLVGDAGYAAGPTGGGTSLALAGGYILAGELLLHHHGAGDGDSGSGDSDGVSAALRAYSQQMQPLIADLQKIPPLVGTILAPQTRWGIFLRNWAFAVVAWTGVVEWVQRWFGGAAFASTSVEGGRSPLREYAWVR